MIKPNTFSFENRKIPQYIDIIMPITYVPFAIIFKYVIITVPFLFVTSGIIALSTIRLIEKVNKAKYKGIRDRYVI